MGMLSGKALDVSGASTADGAGIAQWTRHDGANQRFRLTDSPDGCVRLLNRNSGKAVEVQNASTSDGAKVVQFTDWGETRSTPTSWRSRTSPSCGTTTSG